MTQHFTYSKFKETQKSGPGFLKNRLNMFRWTIEIEIKQNERITRIEKCRLETNTTSSNPRMKWNGSDDRFRPARGGITTAPVAGTETVEREKKMHDSKFAKK